MIGIVDPDRKATRSCRTLLALGFILGVCATVAWQLILGTPYNYLTKAVIAVPGAVTGSSHLERIPDDSRCGNNSREAEAAGCHFDVMASRWYSTECFNGDVLDQMLQEVSFDWVRYLSKEGFRLRD